MKPENLFGFVRFPGIASDRIGDVLRSHEDIHDVTRHLPYLCSNDNVPVDWASVAPQLGNASSNAPTLMVSTTTGTPDGVVSVVGALDRAICSSVRSAVILVLEAAVDASTGDAQGHLSSLLHLLNRLRRYHHRICVHREAVRSPREEIGRLIGLFGYHVSSLPRMVLGGASAPLVSTGEAGHAVGSKARNRFNGLLESLDERAHGEFFYADEAHIAREIIMILRQAEVR